MPSSTSFTLRLDEDIKNALEAEAVKEDRSASYLAAKAITDMLAAKQAKAQAIEQALAEAEKGVFISEKAMTRWVDSWTEDQELPFPEPDIFPNRPAGEQK
jgi:predicted transcriptional regulator